MALEKVLVIIGPPILGWSSVLLVTSLVDVQFQESPEDSVSQIPHIVLPLMIPSFLVLAATIFLDVRANERFIAPRAMDLRLTLRTSAFITLSALILWTISATERHGYQYAVTIFAVLYGPTLLICGALLWYSVIAVKSNFVRLLILIGFVLASVWIQVKSQTTQREGEEVLLVFNSTLIALAIAVRLCTWGATQFRVT